MDYLALKRWNEITKLESSWEMSQTSYLIMLDNSFRYWATSLLRGLTAYCIYMPKGALQCFEELKDEYGLEGQDFYKYLLSQFMKNDMEILSWKMIK